MNFVPTKVTAEDKSIVNYLLEINVLDKVMGVDDFENISPSIYPNPTEGLFSLNFGNSGTYNIAILDVTGKILLRQTVTGPIVQIDISGYPVGIYLVSLDQGKQKTTIKIVKDR